MSQAGPKWLGETIKTHEAVIQGVAKDYLPRVTILWFILTSAALPTGKPTTMVLKDIGSAEKKLQYVAKTVCAGTLYWLSKTYG